MPSIRQQIATFVLDALTDAVLQTTGNTVTSGKVLELQHKASLLAECRQKPAIHFTLGDESAEELEIDTQGVTAVTPLQLKIETADYLDLPTTVETLAAAVQTAIEADRTFGGLLSNVAKYAGRQEFLVAATAPDGGCILTYLLQYRRKHALPSTGY